jgi:hypothetical protein
MSIEAMKQALDALEEHGTHYARHEDDYIKAITALREAIEFQEMVKKGTKAWADTPDNWVDDLRGGVEKQGPVDWDLSNSATVERARKVVKLITERNQNVWSETDRETVHAINALINFAVVQFHRANTAPPKREWVGLTVDEIDKFMPYCHSNQDLSEFRTFASEIEAKLRSKNT